jgi:hypothetical protein
MIDTVTSQNTDLSYWDALYLYITINYPFFDQDMVASIVNVQNIQKLELKKKPNKSQNNNYSLFWCLKKSEIRMKIGIVTKILRQYLYIAVSATATVSRE